jgi:hypothetical protein
MVYLNNFVNKFLNKYKINLKIRKIIDIFYYLQIYSDLNFI